MKKNTLYNNNKNVIQAQLICICLMESVGQTDLIRLEKKFEVLLLELCSLFLSKLITP